LLDEAVKLGHPRHEPADQVQNEQEEEGMQEEARWGRDALEAGDPGTGHLTGQLEGCWTGRNSKGDARNEQVRHLILATIKS